MVREVVQGAQAAVICRVIGTQRSMVALINTAYIERLNATFRERLAPLARRTRAGVHKRCTLERGMWLVGTTYNFVGRTDLGRAAPRRWRGDHGSSLVDGGVVDVSGATCGAIRVAREEAEMAAGGGACSLTTVQCGATVRRSPAGKCPARPRLLP